uniref:lipopolysaccharide biosynthesis protein n=1 Tax=Parerythrobacter lutipelagi TaxID=1964208 RepID=UPI0010F484C0|nr:lipopolysaccharide biosynthesis protein [Parerythrobacter lutipelagi]
MKRLLRNIGWLLSGRAVNALLSLLYLALATRSLGLEAFGYFALIVALGQTVTGLANFQTWQFVVRWGANGDGAGEATGFAIALDAVSVVIGAVLAAGLVYSAQFWLPLPHDLLWVAFGFCILSLLFMRSTPTGLLRLRFRFAEATAAEAVQPIVRAIGAIAAFFYMPTVLGFIFAWAAAEVAVALALWWAAARKDTIDFSQISLTKLPRAHPDAWRFVLSTNAMGSLNVGGKQVMILLVGAIGGEAFAGGFRVAAQLGQALVSLAQTVSKAIYPELVHAKDDAVEIARKMANLSLIGGFLAVLFAVLFGRWGLEAIAGEAFGVVYWTMVILAVAGAIELVGASLESLLVSANRAGTAFLARAFPMGLAFALLPVAMGWQGLKGAAITVLGSSALAVFAFWVAILSLQQIKIILEPNRDGTPPPR